MLVGVAAFVSVLFPLMSVLAVSTQKESSFFAVDASFAVQTGVDSEVRASFIAQFGFL